MKLSSFGWNVSRNFFSSIFARRGKENMNFNVIINLISIYEIEGGKKKEECRK